MRKTIIAAIAATMLLGCGKDSTGPDDVNPNPEPETFVITVNGTDFSPATLPATANDTVYVGDFIKWTVAESDDAEHQIAFVDFPAGVQTHPTNVLTAGQSDSTSFLKPGEYRYKDTKNDSGNIGVLKITALR